MSACGRAGEWQVIFVRADQHNEFYPFRLSLVPRLDRGSLLVTDI